MIQVAAADASHIESIQGGMVASSSFSGAQNIIEEQEENDSRRQIVVENCDEGESNPTPP